MGGSQGSGILIILTISPLSSACVSLGQGYSVPAYEGGDCSSIVQIRKLRLRQVKQLAQSDAIGIPAQVWPGPQFGVKTVDSGCRL